MKQLDYIRIIRKQDIIKLRLNQQTQNILWSAPYLNLSNYFPFYLDNVILHNDQIIIQIGWYYFFQRQGQYAGQTDLFLWNPTSKKETLLIQFYNGPSVYHNAYHLYNFPKHFGIITQNEKDACYINKDKIEYLLIGTTLYKQTDNNNENNWDNYLVLNSFGLKNYKTSITSDQKLQLIYDEWYGDYINNNNNMFQREFLFELISNPCYLCQVNCSSYINYDKTKMSIDYKNIKNYYHTLNDKAATYYMHNMPKQECFLDINGQEIFVDYNKEDDIEYNTKKNNFQYRPNSVNYHILNKNINTLKLRIY